jgi:hypothetical protein
VVRSIFQKNSLIRQIVHSNGELENTATFSNAMIKLRKNENCKYNNNTKGLNLARAHFSWVEKAKTLLKNVHQVS